MTSPYMTSAKIVATARSWLGTPYHHQAALKGVGCDCLGLVRGVYEELYGKPAEAPPPYSRDWAEASATETMLEAARRHLAEIDPREAALGDVVVFRLRRGAMAKHCGIVVWSLFTPDIRPALAHLAVGPEVGAVCEMGGVSGAPGSLCAPDIRPALAHLAVGPEERASWKMIHAMEGAPACEVHLNSWWRRRIAAAFRFPDQETTDVQPLPQP
jgi:NlpC/P60 family putative phage cell wall peptidase